MSAEPYLIGDAMTGGYGAGPDILHDCTGAVEKGQIEQEKSLIFSFFADIHFVGQQW